MSGKWPDAMAPDLNLLGLVVNLIGGTVGTFLGTAILGTLGIFCIIVPLYLRVISSKEKQ
jgi:uncharacterized membrane protein YeaQ/YmgE (transglycosylase-associated protein family)